MYVGGFGFGGVLYLVYCGNFHKNSTNCGVDVFLSCLLLAKNLIGRHNKRNKHVIYIYRYIVDRGGVTIYIYIYYIYIYIQFGPRYGVRPLETIRSQSQQHPKVQDYTDYTWTYRAAAQHGAYDPRSLAREGGSLCPPYPATSPIITHIFTPHDPRRQVQTPVVSYPTWTTPKNQIPYRKTLPAAFRAPWFRFATLFSDDCVPVVAFDALVLRSPNLELCSRPNGPFWRSSQRLFGTGAKRNTQNHVEILVIIIHLFHMICIQL